MTHVHEIQQGDGWAAGSLEAMGEGPGFRKVRHELGVQAFGVNAIVLPPRYRTRAHTHETQEELYIALRGEIGIVLDGEVRTLGPGAMARVDAHVPRQLVNETDAEAVYVCIGGHGGYVARDGQPVEGALPMGPLD